MSQHPRPLVQDLMRRALRLRGMADDDAEFLATDYLEAQLEGKATHGLGKFLLIDAAIGERQGSVEMTRDRGALVVLDGHRELGHLAGRHACSLAIDRARAHGVSVVALTNTSRYSRLTPFARLIAESGFVGIVMNNAGPPAVAPHGAAAPLLGTNPVCFAFPTDERPVVVDLATSERTWGEIRQAMLEGRPLPDEAFLDAGGRFTTDPRQAEAVLPFGGAKGSALCLSVELLAGCVAGAAMGGLVDSEYDLGALFIALDAAPGSGGAVTRLLGDVRALPAREGFDRVRVPGDRSAEELTRAVALHAVEIDDETFGRLVKMSESTDAVIESTTKTN